MIDPMTDAPWFRLRPLQETCSGLRAGQAARGRRFVDALRGMARMGAPWRQLPPAYGNGTRSIAAGPAGATKAYGRASLQADPDLSAVLLDSTVGRAHIRAAGVPKRNGASRLSCRPGLGARTPSPTTRSGTRRATPGNGASAGSREAARGHPL